MANNLREQVELVVISIISASIYSTFLGDNISYFKEKLNNELYFNFDLNNISIENWKVIIPSIIIPLIDIFVFAYIYMTYLSKVYNKNGLNFNIFNLVMLSLFPRLTLHSYLFFIDKQLWYYHIGWVIFYIIIFLIAFYSYLKTSFHR